jgi:predicted AAA+ superfamily ATPase
MHAQSVFMLADPLNNFSNREIARLDVNKALEGAEPHLVDEWQEVPAIWDAVRYKSDERTDKGRFILTGSSTPRLKGVLHSGTGRIASLPMHPMSLQESGDSACTVSIQDVCDGKDIGVVTVPTPTVERLIELVLRGGWPGSIGLSLDQAMGIAHEYVENIVKIDIHRLDGIDRDSVKVRKCLRSLARNESTTASTATIRDDIAEVDGGPAAHGGEIARVEHERVALVESADRRHPRVVGRRGRAEDVHRLLGGLRRQRQDSNRQQRKNLGFHGMVSFCLVL